MRPSSAEPAGRANLFWKPGTKRPEPSDLENELAAEGLPVVFNPHALLSIQQQRRRLPIFESRRELLYMVETFSTVVVVGHTGCGKTTQLPQYLHEAGWTANDFAVACTQPRRLAATSVAERVAAEMGLDLGGTVGYAVRFDERCAPGTKIKYMTDGMLVRETMSDPLLTRYSVIMVDEAHERSVHTDVLLGLLKKVQAKRPALRLIIASATVDAEAFRDFFETQPPAANAAAMGASQPAAAQTASIISLRGSGTHPIRWNFLAAAVPDYLQYAVEAVLDIHARPDDGDILLFLTGQQEVEAAISLLNERRGRSARRLLPLPIFSGLSNDAQLAVFRPPPRNTRKVVVATNIAETSITIDGIVFVVDCGFTKQRYCNPRSGQEALIVTPESQASARQRAGRAGRTRAGEAFLLMTEEAFHALAADSIPEIQRCSLAGVVLQLKALGIDDVLRFDFISPPPPQGLARALEQLYALGAIDGEGALTADVGERMCQLPLEPQLAKALLAAEREKCTNELLSICALLSLQSVFRQLRPADLALARAPFAVYEGDPVTLVNVLRAYTRKARATSEASCVSWCRKHLLNHKVLQRVEQVRKQLSRHLVRFSVQQSAAADHPRLGGTSGTDSIRRALVCGYFANAARQETGGRYRATHRGAELRLSPNSVLYKAPPEWIIYHETVFTENEHILSATKVSLDWLTELAPHFFELRTAGGMRPASGRQRSAAGGIYPASAPAPTQPPTDSDGDLRVERASKRPRPEAAPPGADRQLYDLSRPDFLMDRRRG